MNDRATIKCSVCGKTGQHDIDECIKLLLIALAETKSNVQGWICSDSCRNMYNINPLPYEGNRFVIKDEIIALTRQKYGL